MSATPRLDLLELVADKLDEVARERWPFDMLDWDNCALSWSHRIPEVHELGLPQSARHVDAERVFCLSHEDSYRLFGGLPDNANQHDASIVAAHFRAYISEVRGRCR